MNPAKTIDQLDDQDVFSLDFDFENITVLAEITEKLDSDQEKAQEILAYELDNSAEELIDIEENVNSGYGGEEL